MTAVWTGEKVDDIAMTVDVYAHKDVLGGATGSKEHVDRRLHAFAWSCRVTTRKEAKARAAVAALAALQTLRAIKAPQNDPLTKTRPDGTEPLLHETNVIHADGFSNDHTMELRRALSDAFRLEAELKGPLHDLSREEATAIGGAALRHAASRAKLPDAPAVIAMYFKDEPGASPLRTVDVELTIESGEIGLIADLPPTPGLIAVQAALGVLMVTAGPHRRDADLGVATIEIPGSATLRAATVASLERARSADAQTLRAFMARFNLTSELP